MVNRTMARETARPRRSLGEMVDRVMAALFREESETAEPSVTRTIHQARRLKHAGDVDGALAVLAGLDTALLKFDP